jgi:hypothetical protein
MRGRLGAVAAKVIDMASRCAKNGPARDPAQGKGRGCRGVRSSSGRFFGWTITPPTKQVQRNAMRFCRGFRGAVADERASFLRQRGEQMQDEGINVWAEMRDQEQLRAKGGKGP